MRIIQGDCRDVMRELEPASVDAIVTDPPYGLGFMGKGWDHGTPGVEFWLEALRVAKPGAHLLAFGGTRTFHRLACAIEDAGWKIRDCIMWVYGEGFPKSRNVSKAIDEAAGAERQVIGQKYVTNVAQGVGLGRGSLIGGEVRAGMIDVTAPATDEARRWDGWGTALKPAWEPIIIARAPMIGPLAENILKHGTGALNIDGCRISPPSETYPERRNARIFRTGAGGQDVEAPTLGRWPANLVHDGSDQVVELFPEEAGNYAPITGAEQCASGASGAIYGDFGRRSVDPRLFRGDSGSAARFFYCAKASAADRGEGNAHPTVKPGELMRWLVRLVTPPRGTILDPFSGSGSTAVAAKAEDFSFIGIELDPESCELARRRIAAAPMAQLRLPLAQSEPVEQAPAIPAPSLFD